MTVIVTNYFAVIGSVLLSAAASMVLGMFWYSLLFGKVWMQLAGIDNKKIEEAKKKGMAKTYLIAFMSAIIMSFVLMVLFQTIIRPYIVYPSQYTNDNISERAILTASYYTIGLRLSFLLWMGFIATTLLGVVLWENKPVKLYLINAGYYLINMTVMAVIFAFFANTFGYSWILF